MNTAACALSGPFNFKLCPHCGKQTICPTSHCVTGRPLLAPQELAEQLKAAGKGLGFQEKPVILDFSGAWYILLEDGPQHQQYKANTWRRLYSQSPTALENWGCSMFKTSLLFSLCKCISCHHLYKLICRRLIWGSTRNFYLVFGFQDSLWAGYSPPGISVSYNARPGGECMHVSVSPLCPNMSLPEIPTLSANGRKKRKCV